jgi:MFS family permease
LTHLILAAALAKLGEIDMAKATAARVLQLQPDFRLGRHFAGADYAPELATSLTEALRMQFFMFGMWSCLYAYTPELYPTRARSTGAGMASACGRVGAITGPIVVGYIIGTVGDAGVFTLGAASFALAAWSCSFWVSRRADGRSKKSAARKKKRSQCHSQLGHSPEKLPTDQDSPAILAIFQSQAKAKHESPSSQNFARSIRPSDQREYRFQEGRASPGGHRGRGGQ